MSGEGAARWRGGGCHCGAVRFEVRAADGSTVLACNCSICRMTGFHHLIAGAEDFRLLRGQDNLTEYRFNTGAARHLFCKTCGVKSFYIPRSHPDGYSINYYCIDPADQPDVEIKPFDGQNWEANVEGIR